MWIPATEAQNPHAIRTAFDNPCRVALFRLLTEHPAFDAQALAATPSTMVHGDGLLLVMSYAIVFISVT